MREGDAVLQPPGIRHRVLESSPGLEVIEVGSPALHDTFADHALALPTADVRPERHYHGQRFVRHQAAGTPFVPWRAPGFVTRDLGIAAATSRLAEVRVVRADMDGARLDCAHDGELALYVVLAGAGAITCEGHGTHTLAIDDAFAVPAGPASALVADAGLELLLVTLPAV